MLDTRGSGTKYSREQISGFIKVRDIFTNDRRCIYAELLCTKDGQKVYFREWLSSNDSGDSCSFCLVNSISEFKEEIEKDVKHGDVAPGKAIKICEEISDADLF